MISLRIREDHAHGPLYVTRTTDLAVALDDTRNVVELGDAADALRVAGWIEDGSGFREGDGDREALCVDENDDGTLVLYGDDGGVTLGDETDALLVAKCIEVASGDRDRSDLTEQELEKLDGLQKANL